MQISAYRRGRGMARGRAALGAPWYPLTLAGIKAAYTADPAYAFTDTAGTTAAADGQAVARVNDRSPSGFNLLQSTANARPTLALSGGVYRLSYDATNDRLFSTAAAGLNGSGGFTAFLAGEYPLAANQVLLFGKYTTGTSSSWMLRDNGGTGDFQAIVTTDGGATNYQVQSSLGNQASGNFVVVAQYSTAEGGLVTIRLVNGSGDQSFSDACPAPPFAGTDPLDFGGAGCGDAIRHGLFYDRALTTAEQDAVIAALQAA